MRLTHQKGQIQVDSNRDFRSRLLHYLTFQEYYVQIKLLLLQNEVEKFDS